jgi:hypothetical protein
MEDAPAGTAMERYESGLFKQYAGKKDCLPVLAKWITE